MATTPTLGSRSERTQAKRERIVECAMRHFAEQGYHGAKVEDIARELGIAKGSIFQHFKSKAGLFFEAYKRAATSLPAWLDVPEDVKAQGFFGVVTFWLERTEHLIKEDWVPNRVIADRELRHRPGAEARHQPVPGERGPLRHAGVRGMGSGARRGPRRRRPGDAGVDGRLAVELASRTPW